MDQIKMDLFCYKGNTLLLYKIWKEGKKMQKPFIFTMLLCIDAYIFKMYLGTEFC